jgi:SAM-dependent methyltransferase
MSPDEIERLRTFWNARYEGFGLSASGWYGAGDRLNHYIYLCKRQALRRSLAALGRGRTSAFSVLDAGCGQGFFARVYGEDFPGARYVGVDISDRVVEYLRGSIPAAEFHAADICQWSDPKGRVFDVVQSFEVLHNIADDDLMMKAVANLARHLAPHGALLVTAALPNELRQTRSDLRFRSRGFWQELLGSLRLRIVAERPMYYWIPFGGPQNRYGRYALARLGPLAVYALDRVALAAHLPGSVAWPIDCRIRLLTIARA